MYIFQSCSGWIMSDCNAFLKVPNKRPVDVMLICVLQVQVLGHRRWKVRQQTISAQAPGSSSPKERSVVCAVWLSRDTPTLQHSDTPTPSRWHFHHLRLSHVSKILMSVFWKGSKMVKVLESSLYLIQLTWYSFHLKIMFGQNWARVNIFRTKYSWR